MPPTCFYNQGTGRSYINATRIDCGTLDAANVTANSVSSSSLSGGAQNGLGPQIVDYNASTTSSNSYAIINKPVLAQVATTGSYNSLANVPALSNVAITGSYNSLANIPSFANVAFTNSYNSLSNLPALSQVAYTGAYANLSGKPTNLSSFTNDLTSFSNSVTITGNATVSKSLVVAGNVSANLIVLPNANFTGKYSELQGTPSATYTASSNIGTLVANTIAGNTLSLSANVDYPVNITENYSSGVNGYTHALSAINTAQALGEAFVMQVGQTAGQYGCSYLGHVNQGPQNSTNYATIGLYSQDRILNVTANRQVGVNTTTPAYALDVVGNVRTTALLTANNGIYSGACVNIGYNPNVYALLCPGSAQMGFTQFGTGQGMPFSRVDNSNGGPGPGIGNPWSANTVTNTLNFIPNSFQQGNAAAIQVRDDGNQYLVNGGYVQPSAYMSFQTGGTERLLIGNSGQVTVAGNITTTSVTQTNASFLSRYQLTSNVAISSGGTATLNTWPQTPSNTVGAAAPISCDGTNFTINRSGIYSVHHHARYNASASENSSILQSSGGTWGQSVLDQSGTAAYDPNPIYTGYLAKGDVLYARAFSSSTNTVCANVYGIPTFMHFALLTPCA